MATQEQPQNKVDRESAEAEFDRFLETFELDFDAKTMDEDDAKGYESQKEIFIKAVERGKLFLNDEGNPTLKTSDGLELVFHEPTGAAFTSTDRAKAKENITKKNILLASITKTSPVTFAKMKQRDLKICDCILMLFLA